MADQQDDRRKHERAPIELKVEYKRLNAFFADYTRNISQGGTFIRTDKPLPVGTEFVFKLVVPEVGSPIEISGEVMRIVDDPDEPGMGIRFIYKTQAERDAIEELVQNLMVSSLGELVTAKLMTRRRNEENEG